MKFRLRISILELLLVTTGAAIACVLLASGSAIAAHLAVTLEVLLLIALITLIPSSHGGRRRFLLAFVATAVVFRIFSDYGDWAPLELVHERAWLAMAQYGANPPPPDALRGPRPDGLIHFLDTARPLTGLFLAALSGFLARGFDPDRPDK
jgi:hypothetical protein